MKTILVILSVINALYFKQIPGKKSHPVKGICITESSHYPGDYGCENTLDGALSTGEGNEWASKEEGVGAYFTVQFKKRYTINRIKLVQRQCSSELNKEIQLCFEDGSCQLVSSRDFGINA